MLSKLALIAAFGVTSLPLVVSCSGPGDRSISQSKQRWAIVTQLESHVVSGQMQVDKVGDKLTGIGFDERGRFQLSGRINRSTKMVHFLKQYLIQDPSGRLSLDRPLVFDGTVGLDYNGRQAMEGSWRVSEARVPADGAALASGRWMAIEK
jgi:hypothetical protein